MKQFFLEDDLFFIEMEYADGGTLLDLIEYQISEKKLLSTIQIWKIFLRLLLGMDGLWFSILIDN
ncbi:hypothetical protein FACS189472_16270 [Alphaproteobacteria bacterium]|nr:hypothetical protein FACS189472_16270 [Alphaproteobacteria bacterium]